MSNEPWQEMQEHGINSNKIFELMVSYFNLTHFTIRIVFFSPFFSRQENRHDVKSIFRWGVRPSDLRGAYKGGAKYLGFSQVVHA